MCQKCQGQLTEICLGCQTELETKIIAGLLAQTKRLKQENARLVEELMCVMSDYDRFQGDQA